MSVEHGWKLMLAASDRFKAGRMVLVATVVLCLLGFAALAADQAGAEVERLVFEEPSGVKVLKGFSGGPNTEGVVRTFEVVPGDFEVACYWAPFQKYDFVQSDRWYNGMNRLQPLAVNKFNEMKEGGVSVLFRTRDGQYLAVLPLTGGKTMGWLAGEQGRLVLKVGNLGTARVEGDIPVVAWCRSRDPYAACRQVWDMAVRSEPLAGRVKLRKDKALPEFLNYVGFGTWEEYRGNYNEEKLVAMIAGLNASGVPVRWIQIGAGHHDMKPLARPGKGQKLNSFRPDAKKFPNGWKPVMDALSPDGVSWLGLFQAMNGSFSNGVHPENDLGELNRYLMEVPGNQLQPKNSAKAADAFYDAMIGAVDGYGFTFIKMDFQTPNTGVYLGTEDPVGAAANNMQAYQKAVEKHLQGTINCMAHNPVCLFNTRNSNMNRVSQDYKKGDLAKAVRQIHNCYGNLPVIGQTSWGDFDMFHSSDAVSGHIMAVAKAVSGGTVYVSDKVSEISKERVMPICYADGRTLRPVAPPTPLPESLFMDPFKDGRAYRAIVPLAHETAAVVAYNLSEPAREVSGQIRPSDYAHASAMVQPYAGEWSLPKEGLVLYDWRAGKVEKFDGERTFQLKDFNEDRFFLLCPVKDGWAIVGRTDKYLSPAAVKLVSRNADEIVLEMIESGPLAVWSATGRPRAEGFASEFSGGLLKVDVRRGEKGVRVRVRR